MLPEDLDEIERRELKERRKVTNDCCTVAICLVFILIAIIIIIGFIVGLGL
jgi:predicted anti-sigma-YlaC factor YlaD